MSAKKKIQVILGLQWGDEGKGKFIDFLVLLLARAERLLVARFQGGSNAGHSIEFGDRQVVFHSLPSGMLEKNTWNLVGAGVNVDVLSLKKEIGEIESFAPWWRANLFVAREACVVVPSAKLIEAAEEASRGAGKIGTTGKAIGPTYSDFYGRTDDLSVAEAIDEAVFAERYQKIKESHLKTLKDKFVYEYDAAAFAADEKEFLAGVAFLRTLTVVACHPFMQKAMAERAVLAEGAQGSLLDVRFGTRRDVTSSHTTSAGACVGLGVAPSDIGSVIGVCKAYATRVGSGPFPTELGGAEGYEWARTHTRADEADLGYDMADENPLHQGIALRTLGKEYGATTGRLRRCGWLDLPLLKYAIALSGVTELGITKLDVLDTLAEIPVCVGYEGREGADMNALDAAKPVYKILPGWQSATKGMTSYGDLPPQARAYIEFIEREAGVPVRLISTGPKRDEMIRR